MKVNNMHDELIPMTDRIPQKMLSITRFDSMKSPSISPPIMKHKFNSVDRSYYSPQLTSSDVSSNEEHLEEDDDLTTTMSRSGAFMLNNRSLKGAVGKLNAADISLPSPPSSTASSLDQDGAICDSFMSNGDFVSYDSDIILEECKVSPEEDLEIENQCRSVLDDLVDKTVEECAQDEIWASVKINFDGETILPNGNRLNNGIAVMEYQRNNDTPRFTNQLNYLKTILQKNLLRFKSAQPFVKPVNSIALKIPHYYQIVREPMDLNTIKHRLNFLWYQNAAECIADFRLILDNCFKFNAPQDFVFKSGKTFEKYFNEKLKELPEDEEEIACPAVPDVEEYFKEKETRLFKRVDPILQENARLLSAISSPVITPALPMTSITPVTPNVFPVSKMTTRSVRGLKLKKPTKDLTTYTEGPITPDTPKCKSVKRVPMNAAMKWCHEVVKEFLTKKHAEYAWPFYHPVDLNVYADYLQKVKKPMDLTTIKGKIETGQYSRVDDFAKDVRTIFTNCIRYNAEETPIFKQGQQLRYIFEHRLANIPEEFMQMRTPRQQESTPSVSRNVSPANRRESKSFKQQHQPEPPMVISPKYNTLEKANSKKRKDKEREDRHSSKKAKRSSRSFEPTEMSHALPIDNQVMTMQKMQMQINNLTLALQTALQGGATVQAKKLLEQVAQTASLPPTPTPRNSVSSYTKSSKKQKETKSKRGRKSKGQKRHLSSDESESDDEIQTTFNPEDMDDLKKLKEDLENLPAMDLRNLLEILRETEPSLSCDDDSHIEIDFETLRPATLTKLRKYVDSVKLNNKASSSGHNNNHHSSHTKRPSNPTYRQGPNINNDCDNLSRAPSRASNLQLSEESSSDSEIDD